LHEGAGAVEGAVDDGEVVDFGAAEEEGEVDVPEGLEALGVVDERLGSGRREVGVLAGGSKAE